MEAWDEEGREERKKKRRTNSHHVVIINIIFFGERRHAPFLKYLRLSGIQMSGEGLGVIVGAVLIDCPAFTLLISPNSISYLERGVLKGIIGQQRPLLRFHFEMGGSRCLNVNSIDVIL